MRSKTGRGFENNCSNVQAMVLGAGFGTRLKPLTNYIPKPALPLLNKPLLYYHFDACLKSGINNITVNTHHLADVMFQVIGAYGKGDHSSIHVSREEEILGTGGGIKAARNYFSDKTLLVLNGDVYCEFPLEILYRKHKELGSLATLILRHDEQAEKFGRVFIDEKEKIVSIPPMDSSGFDSYDSGMFTGIHFIEPELFKSFPASDSFCIVRGVYAPLVRKSAPVTGIFCDDYWNDIGTPHRYLEATFELLQRKNDWYVHQLEDNNRWLAETILCHHEATIDSEKSLGPCTVIGPNCHVIKGSYCSHSILLPNFQLQPHKRFTHTIGHPEVTIALDSFP